MSERKMIYLCLAHMSEDGMEQKYVKEAFDTNWVVPMGPNVNAFEQDLANMANSKSDGSEPLDRKVVCLSAGTAAVHLALLACGVQAGDEVCVQSFTFCASSHPITYLGAKPVFIDSERDTWNMDPELLEKAIVERKEATGKYPKAIIPVALYGMPYDCEKIMAFANKYGISERTARNYCAVGKIEGAVLIGKTWSVPKDALLPQRSSHKCKQSPLLIALREQKEARLSGGIYHRTQIDLTYNSNHIEGSRLTHDQTRYIFETNTIGIADENLRVDDIIETANHFRCVDMIIERADRIIHLCEMKFSQDVYHITKEYDKHIRERVGLFKYVTGTKKTVVNTFVTTYGVANGKYSSIVHSNVVLDELFKA